MDRVWHIYTPSTRLACQGRGDGAEAGRRRRELTPSINVGRDAAARTEHAVLAAGEALEVAPAAHCRRADLFVVRARLRVAALLLANCTRC
jgi:hypothetical protein